MSKVAFLYTIGTTYLTSQMAKAADLAPTVPGSGNSALVAGLNGVTAVWSGGPPADPFPSLLDPNIFDAKKVFYPAAGLGMGASIDAGIQNVVNEVLNLPAGQKWSVGGYSQGAAVQAGTLLQMASGGALESRAADFIGGVCFGSPRRALNYRGSVGGTWSGSFNVPGSTTGGHGSFPATGPYRRLTSADCDPLKWQEFAAPLDIFSSVATTGGTTAENSLGSDWVSGNNIFLGSASLLDWASYLLASGAIAINSALAISIGNAAQTMTDAAGISFSWLGGNGHTTYPFVPPVGNPDGALTAYQIALKFLTAKANEYAVAPILLPSTPSSTTGAGWSTTLVAPAA